MTRLREPRIKRLGSKTWIHHQGKTFAVEGENKSTSGRSHAAKGVFDGFIRSPMPGKVLKLNFKEGDKVKKDQTLCVLEAMKMEYALKAPQDGHVKSIFKKQGELVQLDEKLIEIKI